MAAALSGATMAQLAHWRKPPPKGEPILRPELSPDKPILYSFRDIVALRTCVKLRNDASLQKIRKALDTLRVDLGERQHLSEYQLVSDGSTIYLVAPDQAVDLVKRRGHTVIAEMVDVLRPFYRNGRSIPDLFEPRDHVRVVPGVRGGEPVIAGTRIPSAEVAALVRDGIAPERIDDFYAGVSREAALDAADFANYVDSYQPVREAA
ncbi:DUF433 domain-containing protein [Hamadaea flava]|nr:DUF433 domain-containing protein [Hamadaea flava]